MDNIFLPKRTEIDLWVIGNNASGKTSLIKNLISGEDFIGYDTKSYYRNDWIIKEVQHEIVVTIHEDTFPISPTIYSPQVIQSRKSIITLIISPENDRIEDIYNNDYLNVLKDSYSTATVLILFNFRSINYDLNINFDKLKLKYPFIRDFFSSNNFLNKRVFEFKLILREIIINIATNRLKEVKQKIHENKISQNPFLDIGKCSLTSLYEIPELFECDHLETLIISNEWAVFENNKWQRKESANKGNNNNIGILPFEFSKLKNLKIIIAGGDWNTQGKIWLRWRIYNINQITNLTNLIYVNFSNNLIKRLPNLSKLKNLNILHLNNNKIQFLPKTNNLDNLKELYLSNNHLNNLVNLPTLPKLNTLDIHANEIKNLEPLKNLITRTNITNTKWEQNTINVAKNPLEKPPIQIINTGKEAVLNYFKDIGKGRKYINQEVKLILVGNSEVGKTTLAKYLDNEKDLDVKHPSTHWMVERKIVSKAIISKINQKCIINLFDFGGHDYFHDTHHLFYGANTIYLIMWDSNSNHLNLRKTNQINYNGDIVEVQFQDYPLKYWLESIKYFIKEEESENFDFEHDTESDYNSHVMVIQNKVNSFYEQIHLDNNSLHEAYPFIYEFINISILIKKRNLEYFDTKLTEMLNDTPILGVELPGYYGKIKKGIENYKQKPIITIKDFLVYCNSFSNVDLDYDQASYLASYLTEIGLILYFPTGKKSDKVYVNKKWVIEHIYEILKGLTSKKGEFEMKYLDDIFIDKLSSSEKKSLIKLMIDFKMIFLHPIEDKYIAPLYLPTYPLKSVKLFFDEKKLPHRRFIYNGFIHKNVILNIFQQYGKFTLKEIKDDSTLYYYWKDGLIIKDELSGEILMIQFYLGDNDGNAFIDIIKFNIPHETEYANTIIEYIKEINKDYDIEETVTLDGIDFISIDLLNENAREGKLIFSEKRIVDKTQPKNPKSKLYELKNYSMFLDEKIKRKKLVISYSKKDLARVHTFKRYLKPLVDLELIERPWYCTQMITAKEWDNEIKVHFDEADIVVFMVSDYFYSTEYIVEKEIKNTIDRYEIDKSVKIVPILLEHYDWIRKGKYNLGRFAALPYQMKPISDYNNEKIAWYMISKFIRIMIEKDWDPSNTDEIPREIQEILERQVAGKLDFNS